MIRTSTFKDRFLGTLLGLSVGDAMGAPLEFKSPGTFKKVTGFTAGGVHHLPAGCWTDDTSMALCLAESLIARGGFDPRDQMERYLRWWREGYLSPMGVCFDIGSTVQRALVRFQEEEGDPYAGGTEEHSAGNGSLMRLAPVVLYYAHDPAKAMEVAGESSKTTHKRQECVDACRYFAGLLVGALMGVEKRELLSPGWRPGGRPWREGELHPRIWEVAQGSFKEKDPPQIQGKGYVVKSLEAALWAFHRGNTFRDALLLAVNLGDDADTVGAICGQLAGAYYGKRGIPQEWISDLYMVDLIEDYALRLYRAFLINSGKLRIGCRCIGLVFGLMGLGRKEG